MLSRLSFWHNITCFMAVEKMKYLYIICIQLTDIQNYNKRDITWEMNFFKVNVFAAI